MVLLRVTPESKVAAAVAACLGCLCNFTRFNSWREPDIQSKNGILAMPEDTGLSFEYSNDNLPVARRVLSTDGCSKDMSRFQKSVAFEIGFWRKITSLSIIMTCDFSPCTSKVALSKLSEF